MFLMSSINEKNKKSFSPTVAFVKLNETNKIDNGNIKGMDDKNEKHFDFKINESNNPGINA